MGTVTYLYTFITYYDENYTLILLFLSTITLLKQKTAGKCQRSKELVAPQDILVCGERKLGEKRELSHFSKTKKMRFFDDFLI